MSRATSRISSAIHAPCDHDVMTGITRNRLLVGSPGYGKSIVMQGDSSLVFPYAVQKRGLTTGNTGGSFVLFRYSGVNFAVGQAGGDLVADSQAMCVFQQVAIGIEYERIASFENGERRKGFENHPQALAAHFVLQQHVAHDRGQSRGRVL